MTTDLAAFVRESNRIEGIVRDPTTHEIQATEQFLELPPSVIRLKALVAVLQPNARIRDAQGLNVRVGAHVAPPGGPQIIAALEAILERVYRWDDCYHVHRDYETLHPFTDGNGRSGRALWLWQMVHQSDGAPLGFLHQWYYQSLQHSRAGVTSNDDHHSQSSDRRQQSVRSEGRGARHQRHAHDRQARQLHHEADPRRPARVGRRGRRVPVNQQDFDRAGPEFIRILSKLDNADLQAFAYCFGVHQQVEVENDRLWVASAIHSRIAELRRAKQRLVEVRGALRVLGIP